MTDYRIDLKTAAGVKVAEISDYTGTLTYTKKRNAPGLLSFDLPGNHLTASYLTNNAQVEVWRRLSGVDWTCDFYGLVKDTVERYKGNRHTLSVRCPGQMWMLGNRTVAWYASTANRSTFSAAKAETIMKTLVSYNAGANATMANGRLREGAISGLTVAADAAGGNTLSMSCAYDNLLAALQKIAMVAGGDFDLVKTAAAGWDFRFYPGQMGTDRSSTVLFALERGNMAEPELTQSRMGEKTAAIVGGQGEESARAITTRTGANYNASTNNVEVFVNDTSTTNTTILATTGDRKLKEAQAQTIFSFTTLQTPACQYGVHYFLGDKVTAQFGSYSTALLVDEVMVSFSDTEQITVRMANV